MTKKNNLLIFNLEQFETKCNDFLRELQESEIWNLNLDFPQPPSLDETSCSWQIFCNDLRKLMENSIYDKKSMEYQLLNAAFITATISPNKQNINTLKAKIYSFKTLLTNECDTQDISGTIWSYMHDEIIRVSKAKFNDGYYADAVESAFKEVNVRIKKIYLQERGVEKDGADLMRSTFTPNNPVLIFDTLNTETGTNIQKGYMDIFAGSMIGIRNPKAHENITLTELQAVQRLMLASLLMCKIDEALSNTSAT